MLSNLSVYWQWIPLIFFSDIPTLLMTPNTNIVYNFSLISILSITSQGWQNDSSNFLTWFPTETHTNILLVFSVVFMTHHLIPYLLPWEFPSFFISSPFLALDAVSVFWKLPYCLKSHLEPCNLTVLASKWLSILYFVKMHSFLCDSWDA